MHLLQGQLSIPKVLNMASSFGGTGVHIFFICSGFGLYLSQKKSPLTYTQFLKKRFIKIYIPYIVIVIISYFLPFMYTQSDNLNALMSHLFLYKMFISKYEMSFGVQFWFISTIFQFYFIFIPLFKIMNKISSKTFFSLCTIVSICWWTLTYLLGVDNIRIWDSFFLRYLWEFSFGMILANYLSKGNSIKIPLTFLVFAAIFLTGIASVLKLNGGLLGSLNDPCATFGYMSIALLFYVLTSKKIHLIFDFISSVSYEWYLVHILAFKSIFLLFSLYEINLYFLAMVAFFASFGFAILYKILLNLVFNRILNKF